MPRGKYIVIEGTDGTGKSTQVELLADHLQKRGIESIQFHEPDGVPIASELRTIIKNGTLERSALTNLLLFSAARRENWLQQGKPALDRGVWVLSARDYTSTLAYQGYGEGLDTEMIREMTALATNDDYMHPDHKVILDLDDEVERKNRIHKRGAIDTPDTFESKDNTFQQKVIDGYRAIAATDATPVISASQLIDDVHRDILRIFSDDLF